MGLTVLSYNIHKGFSSMKLDFVLKRIKKSIEEVHADVVLLQEVLGQHDAHSERIEEWPTVSQFEFLADRLWPHYAYGRNAVYAAGHHGNAILSKYPIEFWENEDVSTNRIERRGLLHATLRTPQRGGPLHVICVHLGLFETDRQTQVTRLCQRIASMVPPESPLLVGGDFNDWRERASTALRDSLGLEEAYLSLKGSHARTFPSWMPVLKLDRLYYRGLRCFEAHLMTSPHWRELSDHLPIVAEFAPREAPARPRA